MFYHATHKILDLRIVADNQLNTINRLDKTFALPAHAVLSLQGVDAVAFAQAQFANDVTGLAPGNWQWNCWLTAKGRVIALFALIKSTENSLLLLLPDYPAELLAEQLRRYVLRRKVTIEARSDLRTAACFSAASRAQGSQVHVDGDVVELDFGSPETPRMLRLSPLVADSDDTLAARWIACDLQFGLPHLAESQREQWTPQQLSLERLSAFSVKKGCYPGQEIVARTHFLGKAKRGLAWVQADAPMQAGDEVFAGDPNGMTAIGKIVCTAERDALAVLPLEREAEPLFMHGASIRELALREGLRR